TKTPEPKRTPAAAMTDATTMSTATDCNPVGVMRARQRSRPTCASGLSSAFAAPGLRLTLYPSSATIPPSVGSPCAAGLCCVSTPPLELHADCEPADSEGPRLEEGENEDAPSSRCAPAPRGVHARVHGYAQEAELGAAEGRARSAHQRHGGQRLHSRRGAQPAGALCRAHPRRPRHGP